MEGGEEVGSAGEVGVIKEVVREWGGGRLELMLSRCSNARGTHVGNELTTSFDEICCERWIHAHFVRRLVEYV